MSTLTLRLTKGSALTYAEADDNFSNLNTDKLENVVEDTTPQLGGNLDVNGNSIVSTSNGNITLAPNGTGKVVISGDLQVDGTTTTVNSTTVDIDDINITLAKGAANAAAANGGGITLEGPATAASITYANSDDSWNFNKAVKVTGSLTVTGDIVAPSGGGGDLTLAGDGAGNVNLNSDTVRIGDNNANATLTTHGTGDLILNTNAGASSGTITIFDGANANIAITPNGTGSVVLDGINYPQADGTNGQVLTTNGSGTLSFTTVSSGIAGITLTDDTTTNDTRFVLFDDSTSGSQTAFNVSSTKLTFNPSSGTLSATVFNGSLSGNASTATSAATLTTARSIYGNNFDGSAALSQVIASTFGGTGNGFAKFSGPATSEKTFTLPNSNATLLFDGGALGTPSSGTVTNLTGTASINVNGTVGATTPAAGTFTTLTVNAANDLRLADSDSSNYVGFKAPATVSTNIVWTLPSADGTNGQVLTTNGSGVFSFSSASGLTDIVNDTTPQLGGDLDILSRSITTSTVNGAIAIAPNGTGAVSLQTSSITIGTGSGQPQISTNGAFDMFLTTNFNTNSGSITIEDGANGNITLAPNGTGDVHLTADLVRVGDNGSNATITSNGSGDLILNTNSGTNSGSITIEDGPNTNIILAPHGSGRVQVSGTSSNAGGIEFFEDTDNGTNKALLTAPAALGSDITLTLPTTTATLGYLNLPAVGTKSSSYTLATADVGKYVQVASGGSIVIPDAVFAEGDAIVICNNHSAAITITCTITTAFIAGTDSDKATVSLATRGVANILFLSSTVCVISGNVS